MAILSCAGAAAAPIRQLDEICHSRVDDTPRAVTAELELVKVVETPDCGVGIRIASRDTAGTLWATDSLAGLWRSEDDGLTWHRTYNAAPNIAIERVLPLPSGTFLIVVEDTNGNRHVYRSVGAGASSFMGPVLNFPSLSWLLGSQSWVDTPFGVFVAQYGDLLPDVDLWRSTDDGLNFSTAYEIPSGPGYGVRHFHSVELDPYAPSTIWLTAGDTAYQPRIGYSTDGGSTFTFITQGHPPESRAVSLMFTAAAVFWATDSPAGPAEVWRWDRQTHEISEVASGFNGPFYCSVSFRGLMATFSAVELPTNGYTGDQWIHALSSGDGGVTWHTSPIWMRAQDGPTRLAIPTGITNVDANGRFWIAYYDLAGTAWRTVDLEFQLSPAYLRVSLGTPMLQRHDQHYAIRQPLSCDAEAPDGLCEGTLAITLLGSSNTEGTIPRRRFSIPAGQRVIVSVALSRKQMRNALPSRPLHVNVSATTVDRLGRPATAIETVDVRGT